MKNPNFKLLETKENGKKISPALPPHIKNFLIDIDNTVGKDISNEDSERMEDVRVYPDALAKVNQWYDEGHIITFFTSRTEAHREVTQRWLKKHGFKYHNLLLGKPRGGNYHWIDNHMVRVTRFKGKFADLKDKTVTIQVFEE